MKRPLIFIAVSALLSFAFSGCTSREYSKVTIDLSSTGQPIEKYIYGQFIEHLGKCIYGGIWAEMVEDRKFYYPVTADFKPYGTATDEFWGTGPYQYLNGSPWEIIGDGGQVQMELENPYTGEHAVRVHPPGDGTAAGIRQYGLGLIQQNRYTGRIILSGEQSSLPVVVRIQSKDQTIDIPVEEISPEYQTFAFQFESPFSFG